MTADPPAPSTDLAKSQERARALAARYETHVMRLGCFTTLLWLGMGIMIFMWMVEQAELLGLHPWLGLAGGAAGVFAGRELTLAGYRRVRDRLRQRRIAALSAGTDEEDLAHLSAPLADLVRELRSLTLQIQSPDVEPDDTLQALRRWLDQVQALDPAPRERLVELGLDTKPLLPLARLRREPGELTDFWNERAYRRLQSAVPILSHFERQLTRGRDDVYR